MKTARSQAFYLSLPRSRHPSHTGRDDEEEDEEKKAVTPMSNMSDDNEFTGVLSVPLVKASLVHTLKLMDTGRANRRSEGHVAEAAGSSRDTCRSGQQQWSVHARGE